MNATNKILVFTLVVMSLHLAFAITNMLETEAPTVVTAIEKLNTPRWSQRLVERRSDDICIELGTLDGDEKSVNSWQQIFVRRVPCEDHNLSVSKEFFGRAGKDYE